MPVTIRTLNKRKQDGEKFSMLTAYDATFARLISEAGVDAVLIGDSLGNVIQGRDSTVPVTLDDMVYHTRCVARGNQGSLVLADVPFLGAATLERILEASGALMQAGANMVKLEGGAWLAEAVTVLKRNGVPACVHLGLTPQAVNAFGGYRVQGKDEQGARELLEAAVALEKAGAAMLLLECVPRALSAEITAAEHPGDRYRRRPGVRRPGAGDARHARAQCQPGALREGLHGGGRRRCGRGVPRL